MASWALIMTNSHGYENGPRLVAWELTRRCNLNCVHCRAGAKNGPYDGELDTSRCIRILDEISEVGKPVIILTGGEPLLREDIFDLSEYGSSVGLKMVLATNGTLLTPEIAKRALSSGIKRVSISIDSAREDRHDDFRKEPGAFRAAVNGVRVLKEAGLEFQINTTVTRHNIDEVENILDFTVRLGAVAHHIFLLVPTGRAKEMVNQEIDALAYERLLHWFYSMRGKTPLHLKATCAPQYYRILRQEAYKKGERVNFSTYGLDAVTRGCLGGTGFCFISSVGTVQPCGYLEVACGDLRKKSFREIWFESAVFNRLRDFSSYRGKCGRCEFVRVCGGCRARAFEATGDFLAEEPLCSYEPKKEIM